MTHSALRPLLGLIAAAPLLWPGLARSATVATVTFNPANATSTAIIANGGYVTPFGTALHSGTSPDWTVGTSLGTLFQVPTFQFNYSPTQATRGEPGSAVTLGQDADFPQTSLNDRDAIQLGWGSGRGLENQSGADLAIFEAATSEAFAVRLHSTAKGWTDWRYTPYLSQYDATNDATPTLLDFSAFGLGDLEIVNALEITNLLAADTVDTLIAGTADLGYGTVFFGGSSTAGQDLTPARYRSSLSVWVPFEDTKFDPDIQYVVGLHDLIESGVPDTIAATLTLAPLLLPFRAATAASVPAPAPGTLALALPLLGLALRRRRPARAANGRPAAAR